MSARRPWLALGLAGSVLAASVYTGSLWHELPAHFAGRGSFGWPALEAGRWWTLASSLLLTRNAFMALTMALSVAVALGLYERRVGPGRALAVALVGHVTGSVVVALAAGALGRTGWPVAERAAANLDYGASMVVAAALGAIASRSGDRRLLRLAVLGPLVVLLLHHQLADWAHLVACPAGYLVDGARRPRPAAVAALATAALTGWLVLYGPEAVVVTTNEIRFAAPRIRPAPAASRSRHAQAIGHWTDHVGLPSNVGSGGDAGSGGNVGSGGDAGSGGNVGSGGDAGSGGNVGPGGFVGLGGNVGPGGFVGLGGNVGSGGDVGPGGFVGSGGTVRPGGFVGSGGDVGSGGFVGSGGDVGSGGFVGSGGGVGPAGGGSSAGGRRVPAEPRGRIEHLAYIARALGDRPEVATLYVPAHVDRAVRDGSRVPVVVFLHGIPGEPEDWLAGGRLARRLDDDIAAGRFPAALAVLPESATMHDPRAGWIDVPHQPVLRSLRTDLLPALARRFPDADLGPGRVAVVGVGRGADGARRLAALDRRFGFVQAIGSARNHWVGWRSALPHALRALVAAGFGADSPVSPLVAAPTPALAPAASPALSLAAKPALALAASPALALAVSPALALAVSPVLWLAAESALALTQLAAAAALAARTVSHNLCAVRASPGSPRPARTPMPGRQRSLARSAGKVGRRCRSTAPWRACNRGKGGHSRRSGIAASGWRTLLLAVRGRPSPRRAGQPRGERVPVRGAAGGEERAAVRGGGEDVRGDDVRR